ncbi:UDP-glucose 4-epimerase GalE [Rosettibacter firmus]|uniref:UDP-glucose 4-epimerase GalE n=1 Tax=Rosettibacter firmus TaxID=3111522 RepID=UPI00336BEBCB
MKILVTGGAGYIGSHFVKFLYENNYEPIVIDNLFRGHKEAIPTNIPLEIVDLLDYEKLLTVIKKHKPEAVVHFAALAYVGESVENPQLYYLNNVVGSYNLIRAVTESDIKKFVFSSTCSIYGNPLIIPISEKESSKPINPYANTKLIIETMLKDFDNAYGLKFVALRYFNAAGAHQDGEIGESHNPETHLIPLVLYTAMGKRDKLFVYGNDYDTQDGTCIRDYIHVMDLADAHLKALQYLNDGNDSTIINLGTGKGNSVLEIIKKSEQITGRKIPYEITGRRAGDPAILVADNKKAKEVLAWSPKYSIEEIIESAWKWHLNQKY